jgi:hypothetical protein
MSRMLSLVLAGTSALALATVATPVADQVPAHVPTTFSAGPTTTPVGGSWCC